MIWLLSFKDNIFVFRCFGRLVGLGYYVVQHMQESASSLQKATQVRVAKELCTKAVRESMSPCGSGIKSPFDVRPSSPFEPIGMRPNDLELLIKSAYHPQAGPFLCEEGVALLIVTFV